MPFYLDEFYSPPHALCVNALFAHCTYEQVVHTVPVDVAQVKHRTVILIYRIFTVCTYQHRESWLLLLLKAPQMGAGQRTNNLTKFRRQLGEAQTNANILSTYASIVTRFLGTNWEYYLNL